MQEKKHLKKGLLDQLAELAGCEYLSDLRQPELSSNVSCAVSMLNPEDFSLKEWIDAAYYIAKTTHSFGNAEEIKAFLENRDEIRET